MYDPGGWVLQQPAPQADKLNWQSSLVWPGVLAKDWWGTCSLRIGLQLGRSQLAAAKRSGWIPICLPDWTTFAASFNIPYTYPPAQLHIWTSHKWFDPSIILLSKLLTTMALVNLYQLSIQQGRVGINMLIWTGLQLFENVNWQRWTVGVTQSTITLGTLQLYPHCLSSYYNKCYFYLQIVIFVSFWRPKKDHLAFDVINLTHWLVLSLMEKEPKKLWGINNSFLGQGLWHPCKRKGG